jgi:hypothetical protein
MFDQPVTRDASVSNRRLLGAWVEVKPAIRIRWPEVTAEDLETLGGDRDALMRVLKQRSNKTYAQIDREIAEFEDRDRRAVNASRPASGIGKD